jgi:Tol biopolymer transport system component/DNA-binding winged helix-turn-helix (wHTH) protein
MSQLVRFGLYEVDLSAGELRKNGVKIKLQEQPFQILAVLLERAGEVVTREEVCQRLWPDGTFVDFDHSLGTAIKKLRQALGDSADNPRFVETLARRGYRFIGSLDNPAVLSPSSQPDVLQGVALVSPVRDRSRYYKAGIALSGVVLLLAGAFAFWLKPPSPPKVVGSAQITSDGWLKSRYGLPLLSDGSRLYFSAVVAGRFALAQVSHSGGDSVLIPTPFRNVLPFAISPNRAELLIGSFDVAEAETSLWLLPLPGGPPRRLGDVRAHDAAWSPDGTKLVYANGQDLFLADNDGSNCSKLVTVTDKAWGPRWSPDGSRLRFTLGDPKAGPTSLWEVALDGSRLHQLLPGWGGPASECCGNWTRDGKYFVFSSSRGGTSNIWVIRESEGLFRKAAHVPVQLTTGPMSCHLPLPSQDGRKLFVVGVQQRGELVRYDLKSGRFVPYLSGISADWVAFSRDQEWIVYTTYPDGVLWRSKPDGSQRLQLSFSPMKAVVPRWSPDGKQIAFVGVTHKNWTIYLVSAEGGNPVRLVPDDDLQEADPDWSPDGNSIVFGRLPPVTGTPGSIAIHLFDLGKGQLSTIPGSEGLFTPRWSPDGRCIAAMPADSHKLTFFDLVHGKWTDLATASISYLSWSRDGKHIYFDTYLESDPAVYRVGIDDRKLERLASLKGFGRAAGTYGSWSGLTPDDSFLLTRDVGSQEIYALDWVAP